MMIRSVPLSSAFVVSLPCTAYRYSTFSRAFLLFIVVLGFGTAYGQNMLANADFEELNNCTEYHQDCSSEAWFYIKPAITPLINFKAVPQPASGKDLLILSAENIDNPVKGRSFVYTMFCCPPEKEKKYKLSFYINTGGKSFYGMDFYMRSKEFTSDNFFPDSVQPDIHIPAEEVTNVFGSWNYISVVYTARGDEKFLLLGNLSKKPFEYLSYQRMNKAGDIFYFIDDISFSPVIPGPQCKQFPENRQMLYDQNLRHTERVLADIGPQVIIDTITVPAVFFETDKAVLKPAFKKLIDSLIRKFAKRDIKSVKIGGHTDNAGTMDHNNILSAQRAESVRKYFLFRSPGLKDNISAEGKGEQYPIADNKTPSGMAKNRRVEIILTYLKRPE
ncbi:MAG: OmpA family protein [Ferruginibacter sp.]